MIKELYQASVAPKDYFKDLIYNFTDNAFFLAIIAPGNWIRNLRFCKENEHRCEDGIPGKLKIRIQ